MTHTLLTGLDLSYYASGLPDHAAYLNTAAACLSDGVPGDLTRWMDFDLVKPTVEVWSNEDKAYHTCDALAAVVAAEHPIVVHRRVHPDAEPVRRVSDCISDRVFRSGRVYRELFVPMGACYQLWITTACNLSGAVGRNWTINRSTRDFTEADLRNARSLQPVLALLDTIYSSAPTPGHDSAQTEEARKRARLTVRELDILTLVGDGLSAQQISRLRRISARTVRKHLEHVYEKLECHDRLLAVNKARQIGLLHTPNGSSQVCA
jgi:DNA-binding CsgD family transcriptional regulator